eukprot:CAMPEP_0177276316 /NCGR_PEP_ID=MMETSP0367-20130122/68190_1 /TAXON_ID=447022 ORGANISM="Scrippsiella hangoei-like, Strain SHHI-4" /NCGR_SAMPLE_ID=MMETSP0367 /ASSEMBLY_ACC=CAM_ASM_000362 /LENGTH=66 /DNA_ID=CAMNT_0018732819 /DNA_START=35 /DNA_END=235 /DNA_ORIENTATION=+
MYNTDTMQQPITKTHPVARNLSTCFPCSGTRKTTEEKYANERVTEKEVSKHQMSNAREYSGDDESK